MGKESGDYQKVDKENNGINKNKRGNIVGFGSVGGKDMGEQDKPERGGLVFLVDHILPSTGRQKLGGLGEKVSDVCVEMEIKNRQVGEENK
ncbi:MAG: hypothetical protein A3E37_02690 [Candidatus Andersenbacteria bacterium RIFCSPHIGHO2_12_FULL_46_9]|nr:MAG: hypothetical protein A3B76_04570 [Candidatus Andersenbacteria bacterium RIFCSPHIGHO2_02_FULL_46_16]OGY38546.1 MAG: hypothetical protein A3E37_02690 [Candidatus Andersenbacteria bacterium RIFCSPHIGHO2_12_FULL_46_9]